MSGLNRKIHFLGTKIRSLRKLHGFTLEDMVVRCMQIDSDSTPSVSYLSLIETGLGDGPKITPPPRLNGVLFVPRRALPVPF